MVCMRFVKDLILDKLAFENFSLVTNQKFM